ncbi:hypothetical protein FPV67DRAFT_770758 [Lyophyllum atratum]|nr:hypothetical protein FPV67DRAFT_770758 [Lyophyllum atratum]
MQHALTKIFFSPLALMMHQGSSRGDSWHHYGPTIYTFPYNSVTMLQNKSSRRFEGRADFLRKIHADREVLAEVSYWSICVPSLGYVLCRDDLSSYRCSYRRVPKICKVPASHAVLVGFLSLLYSSDHRPYFESRNNNTNSSPNDDVGLWHGCAT